MDVWSARRDELPGAGPAGRPRPADPAGGAEDPRAGGGRSDRGRTEAAGLAQPGGFPAADDEVRSLGNEVWGDCDGRTVTEHAYGQGKVYCGRPLAEVLAAAKTPPDLEYSRPHVTPRSPGSIGRSATRRSTSWPTRRTGPKDVEVRVRVEGKAADLWHPRRRRSPPPRTRSKMAGPRSRLTSARMKPCSWSSARRRASPSRVLPRAVSTELATVSGTVDGQLPAERGRPAADPPRRPGLVDGARRRRCEVLLRHGHLREDAGSLPAWFRPGAKLVLDLGTVKEIAEVSVNGQPAVLLWRPPYRADVTGALKPGPNRIEVKVTNLWATG